jgi:hypothetical protein
MLSRARALAPLPSCLKIGLAGCRRSEDRISSAEKPEALALGSLDAPRTEAGALAKIEICFRCTGIDGGTPPGTASQAKLARRGLGSGDFKAAIIRTLEVVEDSL